MWHKGGWNTLDICSFIKFGFMKIINFILKGVTKELNAIFKIPC